MWIVWCQTDFSEVTWVAQAFKVGSSTRIFKHYKKFLSYMGCLSWWFVRKKEHVCMRIPIFLDFSHNWHCECRNMWILSTVLSHNDQLTDITWQGSDWSKITIFLGGELLACWWTIIPARRIILQSFQRPHKLSHCITYVPEISLIIFSVTIIGTR